MNSFLALMFCKPADIRSYAVEVRDAIKSIAGERLKYGEGGAGITAIAFMSDKSLSEAYKPFKDLWRSEQRTWVVPLDDQCLIDRALMDWVRSNHKV